MKRLRWSVVLPAAMALVAAACTGDGEPTTTGTETAERVTLDYWVTNEAKDEYHDAVVAAFEAEYPNIDLKVTAFPEANYGTKIDTALAAGDPPDLGYVDLRLMREGLALPLEDMVEEYEIDLSTFSPYVVGDPGRLNAEYGCSYEGTLYCLGSYLGSVQLLYNKELFDAAGIPHPAAWPPMTVDEFVETACQLTDPDNGFFGAAYGDPVSWMPWEMMVSGDGRTVLGYVNGPTSVQVHDILGRGIRDRCAPSLTNFDPWEQGGDFFARGELAMVVTDLGGLVKIENQGIDYGVTAPPTPEGLEPFFNTWTDGIGVFAASEHPEEAKAFIAFLATEGQQLRVEITGDLPVDTAVAEELGWAGDVPGRQDVLEILPHGRAKIFFPPPGAFWVPYGPIYDAFATIVGGESAQEALDAAAPAIQENLDKAWERWDR